MTIGMIVMGVEVVDHVWLRTSRNRITPFLRTIILMVIFGQVLQHRNKRRSDPVVTIGFEAHFCNPTTGKAIHDEYFRPVPGEFNVGKQQLHEISWGQCRSCTPVERSTENQQKRDLTWNNRPDMCDESRSFGSQGGREHGELIPTVGYIMNLKLDVEIVKSKYFNPGELFQQFVQMLGNLMTWICMGFYVHLAHQSYWVLLNRTWWQRTLTIFDWGWWFVCLLFSLPAAILKYRPQQRQQARGGGAAKAGAAATGGAAARGGALKTCSTCVNKNGTPTKAYPNGNCRTCGRPC